MLLAGGVVLLVVVGALFLFGSGSDPDLEGWTLVGAVEPDDICPCCKKEMRAEMLSMRQFVNNPRSLPPCAVLMRTEDDYYPGKVICMSCYKKGEEARLIKYPITLLKKLRDPNK